MKEILSAIFLTLREMFTKWFPAIRSVDLGILGTMSKIISVMAIIAGILEYLRKRWGR